MNQLEAKVLYYRTSGQIILCELESFGAQVTAVILDSPGELEYLKEGNTLNILFKETEVIIATGEIGQLSLNNRFRAKITAMEKGEIFTSLALDFGTGMTSVITTKSVERLRLAIGTEVTALVKANEIAIGRRD
ncbi:MAG: molybdopterin-binding protein [Deferribacterales bacterium]